MVPRNLCHYRDLLRPPVAVRAVNFNKLLSVRPKQRHHNINASLVYHYAQVLPGGECHSVSVNLASCKLSLNRLPHLKHADVLFALRRATPFNGFGYWLPERARACNTCYE